jgi:hypothetical protein
MKIGALTECAGWVGFYVIFARVFSNPNVCRVKIRRGRRIKVSTIGEGAE